METNDRIVRHFEDKENDKLMKELKSIQIRRGFYTPYKGDRVFDKSYLSRFSSFLSLRNSFIIENAVIILQ